MASTATTPGRTPQPPGLRASLASFSCPAVLVPGPGPGPQEVDEEEEDEEEELAEVSVGSRTQGVDGKVGVERALEAAGCGTILLGPPQYLLTQRFSNKVK